MPAPTSYEFSLSAVVAVHTAFLDLVDTGVAPGSVEIYDADDNLLATVALDSPSGAVDPLTGQITFTAAAPGAITATGTPAYGALFNGDGEPLLTLPTDFGGLPVSGYLVLSTALFTVGGSVEIASFTVGYNMPDLFVVATSTATPNLWSYDPDPMTLYAEHNAFPGGALPASSANGLAISPNGRYLAVAHATTPFMTVYDTQTWLKVTLAGGNPPTTGQRVAFSPDSSLLAVGTSSSATSLDVYDTSTWQKVSFTPGIGGTVQRVAFSPDGTKLAVAQNVSPYVRVFDTSAWTVVTDCPEVTATANSVFWNPDGSRLYVLWSSTLNYFATADWTYNELALGFPATAFVAVMSPDGTKVAIGGNSTTSPWNRLFVFNVSDWSHIVRGGGDPPGSVFGIAFSPGGEYLVTAGATSPYINVFNTSDWSKRTLVSSAPTAQGNDVTFAPSTMTKVITGTVLNDVGVPSARTVRLHRRVSGSVALSTESTGGDFSFKTMTTGGYQVVCLDDAAGDTFNDLIYRVD
jgi:WD40 repeat protein